MDSLTVDISASSAAFEGAVDAAQLYQASGAPAGINLNVIQEPADGYWSNVWLKKNFSAVYWSGRATEDWMFTTASTVRSSLIPSILVVRGVGSSSIAVGGDLRCTFATVDIAGVAGLDRFINCGLVVVTNVWACFADPPATSFYKFDHGSGIGFIRKLRMKLIKGRGFSDRDERATNKQQKDKNRKSD